MFSRLPLREREELLDWCRNGADGRRELLLLVIMLTGGGVFVFLGIIVSLDSLLGKTGPGTARPWGLW
jgi:hypothetical protein